MKNEIQFKIVKKGQPAVIPINGSGYSWITKKAKTNGIVISFGLRGAPGIFIPETMFRKFFAEFEKEIDK